MTIAVGVYDTRVLKGEAKMGQVGEVGVMKGTWALERQFSRGVVA